MECNCWNCRHKLPQALLLLQEILDLAEYEGYDEWVTEVNNLLDGKVTVRVRS